MESFTTNETRNKAGAIRLLVSIIALLFAAMPLQADGLYDGLYGRPSHFSDFQPPTDWPSNMSYYVRARMDGKPLENYEVAVFDQNGKMRCCSRSIAAQQELCTLTIPGEMGDTLHFKVLYGDFEVPSVLSVVETCAFEGNANVGTMAEPFWLTLMTTGIDDITQAQPSPKAKGIFTIQGVRVSKAVQPGVYIIDGRKTIVKQH